MASAVLERPTKNRTTKSRSKLHRTPTTDAVTIIHRRFVKGKPELEAYLVEELERILIGNQIYNLRTQAGMTQAALAKKVGTKAAEIDRLENADYEGHPLPMLRKIAAVFGKRIEINFVPQGEM
jgi:DNA-binding XRE family transcriptional regulator